MMATPTGQFADLLHYFFEEGFMQIEGQGEKWWRHDPQDMGPAYRSDALASNTRSYHTSTTFFFKRTVRGCSREDMRSFNAAEVYAKTNQMRKLPAQRCKVNFVNSPSRLALLCRSAVGIPGGLSSGVNGSLWPLVEAANSIGIELRAGLGGSSADSEPERSNSRPHPST